MLRKLVLVRHGDAEFFGPEGTDASRRLTKKGKRALERGFPRMLEKLVGEPDLVFWVSPAVRALETAEVAADVLDVDPDEFQIFSSLYEQDDEAFLEELYAEGDGCVVAVGHVPFVYRMLYDLTGEDIPFAKGSVACLSFDSDNLHHATLDWFEEGPRN